ncbi:hypothetical protein NQ317_009881 [Molorchus minor]|uniref:Transmembrane protein n=1 Tax=Molorchus minor TaxID=1323400 RepID=A0ABQ9K4X0_9CUCU|nr:hypothetical protein NQ317_009881 [Molorchus minor]
MNNEVRFYVPPKRKSDELEYNTTCSHEENCYRFSFKGFCKYFSLGYLVNIVRRLLPRLGLLGKKPTEVFKILFNKTNVRFGLFIGSYVGLYRILICELLKVNKIPKNLHGLIAGICSGITYAISPNIQVLTIGITTILQLIYQHISDKLKITNHFWQQQLLFMLCHGALLHNKFFYPETCSPYYDKMVDACTNNL